MIHSLIIAGMSFEDLFDPLTGNGYQFWSGIGANFGELTLVIGLVTFYRHKNCHVKGCPRLGHQVHGTSHIACKRHHPSFPPEGVTVEHIEQAHADAQQDRS